MIKIETADRIFEISFKQVKINLPVFSCKEKEIATPTWKEQMLKYFKENFLAKMREYRVGESFYDEMQEIVQESLEETLEIFK
jgi:hypothetical protein